MRKAYEKVIIAFLNKEDAKYTTLVSRDNTLLSYDIYEIAKWLPSGKLLVREGQGCPFMTTSAQRNCLIQILRNKKISYEASNTHVSKPKLSRTLVTGEQQ